MSGGLATTHEALIGARTGDPLGGGGYDYNDAGYLLKGGRAR
jgi:hypothetical protein